MFGNTYVFIKQKRDAIKTLSIVSVVLVFTILWFSNSMLSIHCKFNPIANVVSVEDSRVESTNEESNSVKQIGNNINDNVTLGNEHEDENDDDDKKWPLHDKEYARTGGNGNCLSIRDRYLYYPPSELKVSKKLKNRLREYEKMQRRCVESVKNWEKHFDSLESGLQDCKYVVCTDIRYGLGNKIGAFLTAFLYGLLTNRALLVESTIFRDLFCNPFPNSSMWIPDGFPLDKLRKSLTIADYIQQLNNDSNVEIKQNTPSSLIMYMHHWWGPRDWEFLCDHVQDILGNIPIIGFDSNQFGIPALYIIPKFHETLNELFPGNVVSTHVARYLLNPSNMMWDIITTAYDSYLKHANYKIGIHIRTFSKYDTKISERILSCLKNVIQEPSPYSMLDPLRQTINSSARSSISIFVASLDLNFYWDIKAHYGIWPTRDGKVVATHTVNTESFEKLQNLNHYHSALRDIFLISMSDTLLVSYHSTFGYTATALAGREAYIMNICEFYGWEKWYENKKPVCELVKSYNGCFLDPPHFLKCDGKVQFDSRNKSLANPYFDNCQDHDRSMALLSNFSA